MNFNLHEIRTKIAIIVIAAFGAGLLIFFFLGGDGQEQTPKLTGNAQSPNTRLKERLFSDTVLEIINERDNTPNSEISPKRADSGIITNSFVPEQELHSASDTDPVMMGRSKATTSSEDTASQMRVSHEEVFSILNPPQIVTILSALEKNLIQNKILPDGQAAPLDSDAAISAFFLKTLDALEQKGLFPKDDASRLRKSLVEDWPKTRQLEYDIIKMFLERSRKSADSGEKMKKTEVQEWKRSVLGFFSIAARLGLPEAITKTLGALSPNSAFAMHSGWHTIPDCYKDTDPQNSTRGINLFAFCCNCGLLCGTGCVFILDCQENSTQCNVPLGCLNLIGIISPNAVWDGPPGALFPITFICGFDFPGAGK